MVEYWLDRFDSSPLEVHRNADGFIQLKDTGDPLIDKWEEKIAAGEEPDLWEAFTPESREELARIRAKAESSQYIGGYSFGETMAKIKHQHGDQAAAGPQDAFNTFGSGIDNG